MQDGFSETWSPTLLDDRLGQDANSASPWETLYQGLPGMSSTTSEASKLQNDWLQSSGTSAERRKLNGGGLALRPLPATPRSAAAGLKVSRWRSNIGPLRIEKVRRRSSLRPPTHTEDESFYLGKEGRGMLPQA